MDWTLEVVVVPVSDVDRARVFYAERVGFTVDHDTIIGPGQGRAARQRRIRVLRRSRR